MVEYIERMSAIETACKGCNKEFSNEPCEPSECYIQQGLFNIPASDVVEVVRCKDCIGKAHWYKNDYGCTICGLSGLFVVEDRDFCSYGERKDNERKAD